mgnify:CR=1 FL=1
MYKLSEKIMKSYNEIREEELIITEKFSNKKLDRYISFVKFIRRGFNINFLWFLSVIIFFLVSSIFILFNFFRRNNRQADCFLYLTN